MDPLLERIGREVLPVSSRNRDVTVHLHGRTAAELAVKAATNPDGIYYPFGAVDLTKPMTMFGCPVVTDDTVPVGEFKLAVPYRSR